MPSVVPVTAMPTRANTEVNARSPIVAAIGVTVTPTIVAMAVVPTTVVPMAVPAAMPDLLHLADLALGHRRGGKGGGRSGWKCARRKCDEAASQRCDKRAFHLFSS